ncbi:putative protein kinase [Blattamonas nauphoetae]|uniref:non-specific serine/threonine protein kinase n=1 Tax=Blattamonas nauphoetae TaxID=2049346 RepID=A0ABQ9Y4U8_9EUKA|nr:putative protein kinase [Blattamonas nauphoetae]
MSDSDDEGTADYKQGGYHPVRIGDLYNNRYKVEQKLGWGHFSTVWFCQDIVTKVPVALKIIKSAPHYMDAAKDEIKLLTHVTTGDPDGIYSVVHLLDHFVIEGPNGKHMCMVFESLGPNLLTLIKQYNYSGIPLPITKYICRQILISLDYIHTHLSIIHTDLKPENILLEWPIIGKKISTDSESERTKDKSRTDRRLVQNNDEGVDDSLKRPASEGSDQHNSGSNHLSSDANQNAQNSNLPLSQPLAPFKSSLTTHSPADKPQASIPLITSHSPASTERNRQSIPQRNNIHLSTPSPGLTLSPLLSPSHYLISSLSSPPSRYEKYNIKLVDFGNACWTHQHFTTNIQTRQYRSPEVILGYDYNTSTDIFSFGCIVFELLTGDLLFEPHSREDYDRDEDHIALFVELLGKVKKSATLKGKWSKDLFTKRGELRHIKTLNYWPLRSVLIKKYGASKRQAEMLCSFLLPCLSFDPNDRPTAAELLQHPWLEVEDGETLQNEEWTELPLAGEPDLSSKTKEEFDREREEEEGETESEHVAVEFGPVCVTSEEEFESIEEEEKESSAEGNEDDTNSQNQNKNNDRAERGREESASGGTSDSDVDEHEAEEEEEEEEEDEEEEDDEQDLFEWNGYWFGNRASTKRKSPEHRKTDSKGGFLDAIFNRAGWKKKVESRDATCSEADDERTDEKNAERRKTRSKKVGRKEEVDDEEEEEEEEEEDELSIFESLEREQMTQEMIDEMAISRAKRGKGLIHSPHRPTPHQTLKRKKTRELKQPNVFQFPPNVSALPLLNQSQQGEHAEDVMNSNVVYLRTMLEKMLVERAANVKAVGRNEFGRTGEQTEQNDAYKEMEALAQYLVNTYKTPTITGRRDERDQNEGDEEEEEEEEEEEGDEDEQEEGSSEDEALAMPMEEIERDLSVEPDGTRSHRPSIHIDPRIVSEMLGDDSNALQQTAHNDSDTVSMSDDQVEDNTQEWCVFPWELNETEENRRRIAYDVYQALLSHSSQLLSQMKDVDENTQTQMLYLKRRYFSDGDWQRSGEEQKGGFFEMLRKRDEETDSAETTEKENGEREEQEERRDRKVQITNVLSAQLRQRMEETMLAAAAQYQLQMTSNPTHHPQISTTLSDSSIPSVSPAVFSTAQPQNHEQDTVFHPSAPFGQPLPKDPKENLTRFMSDTESDPGRDTEEEEQRRLHNKQKPTSRSSSPSALMSALVTPPPSRSLPLTAVDALSPSHVTSPMGRIITKPNPIITHTHNSEISQDHNPSPLTHAHTAFDSQSDSSTSSEPSNAHPPNQTAMKRIHSRKYERDEPTRTVQYTSPFRFATVENSFSPIHLAVQSLLGADSTDEGDEAEQTEERQDEGG